MVDVPAIVSLKIKELVISKSKIIEFNYLIYLKWLKIGDLVVESNLLSCLDDFVYMS